jgi:hypothetical protein
MTAELAASLTVILIPYAFGWLILLLKPSWTFLFAFTAAVAMLGLPGFLADPDHIRGALQLLLRGSIFMVVGGPIVALRLWIRHVEEGARAALDGNRRR